MVKRKAGGDWIAWRLRRYELLANQGLNGHLAWRLSTVEMRARQRIAGAIGFDRAAAAELAVVGRGDNERVVLIGDAATLTSKQAADIQKIAA